MLTASFRATWEPIARIDAGDIGANFTRIQKINDPLAPTIMNPARLFLVKNWTDADLEFSLTGVDDDVNFVVHSDTDEVYDITSNTFTTDCTGIFCFPAGTNIYVRQLQIPTLKSVYVEVIYGSEQL